MLNLTHVISLVETVDTGSFTAAAAKLRVSQPAISQHLRNLETEVGQTLLIRNAGRVQTTKAGEIIYEHGRNILAERRKISDRLAELSGEISGSFSISMSILFSQTIAIQFVDIMRKVAPNLRIELVATDALIDVSRDRVDMVLRAGSSGEGQAVIRRIGGIAGALVAAPGYLDAHGRIDHPDQLDQLAYLQYREDTEQTHLPIRTPDGAPFDAPVTPAFAAHSPHLLLHAIQNQMGFAQAPLFFVEEMLANGELEEVLPGYTTETKPLYLLQQPDAPDSRRNRTARAVLFWVLSQWSGIELVGEATREAHNPTI